MSRCDHGVGVEDDDPLGCSTCDELRGYELAEEDERAEREAERRRGVAWRLGDLLERLGRRLKGDRS